MKKVVSGTLLTEKMTEAVHLICDTVASTLGPKGKNVIIDHSAFSPFITNDGVTIAENVESEDEVIETILSLTKEASIQTNLAVGDGTTSTLVLLKSIFDAGLECIQSGVSPMILKKELDKSVIEIAKMIKQKSRKPTKQELVQIAKISANDEEIGTLVSEAYLKVENRFGVQLLEQDEGNTKINYIKGYRMEMNLASPYFLHDSSAKQLKDSYILLMQKKWERIDDLAPMLNIILKEKRPLILVSEDYSDSFVQDVLTFHFETNSEIYLLKNPEYGTKQLELLKDLECISHGAIVDHPNETKIEHLGVIKNITIAKNEIVFSYQKSANVLKRRKEIFGQMKESQNDLEKKWNQKRMASFQKGFAEIKIGAPTTTERREKKMRFEDALCAMDTATQGILPGSGLVLLEISQKIEEDTIGMQILKEALKKPFYQILENAGIDAKNVFEQIQKQDFTYLYNVQTDEYEFASNTNVVDATKVVIESLVHAVSIAGMLLTTNHLIINEVQNEINKESDYTEM